MSETKPLTMTPDEWDRLCKIVTKARPETKSGSALLATFKELHAVLAALAEAQSDRDEARGRYKLLASAIHDHEGDCLPGCNSYGHEEGCPTVTEAITLERQQRALTAAQLNARTLREAANTLQREIDGIPNEGYDRMRAGRIQSATMKLMSLALSAPADESALREIVTRAVAEGFIGGRNSTAVCGGRQTLNEKAAIVNAVLGAKEGR